MLVYNVLQVYLPQTEGKDQTILQIIFEVDMKNSMFYINTDRALENIGITWFLSLLIT